MALDPFTIGHQLGELRQAIESLKGDVGRLGERFESSNSDSERRVASVVSDVNHIAQKVERIEQVVDAIAQPIQVFTKWKERLFGAAGLTTAGCGVVWFMVQNRDAIKGIIPDWLLK